MLQVLSETSRSSQAANRYQRILRNARRALSAFDYDVDAMSNAEIEATCIALNAWVTLALQALRPEPRERSPNGQHD